MIVPSRRMRNLQGYGLEPPDVVWPNGARLAVMLNVNFEEGAEPSVESGDSTNERFGEVNSVVPPSQRDLGMEELFAYGTRVGLRRFLDGLDRYALPATFLFCGLAVQRSPALAREVVRRGHEPVVHGWRWVHHAGYEDPEQERADIIKTRDTIEQITGVQPVGFICRGSQSLWTRQLLVELGFEYDSNGWDDDLPYWDTSSDSGPLLVLPYALDSNDMKFYHPNGFGRPDDFSHYVQCALDVLLAEAERGQTKVLNLGFHLRITGRPGRWWAVEQIFRRLQELGDRVWIARRKEVADCWRQCQPKP